MVIIIDFLKNLVRRIAISTNGEQPNKIIVIICEYPFHSIYQFRACQTSHEFIVSISSLDKKFIQTSLEKIFSNLFKIMTSVYKYLKNTLNS
jgi:hypothetical protein